MPEYRQCYGCEWCVVGVPETQAAGGIYCTWERETQGGQVRPIDSLPRCPQQAGR